MINVSQNYEMVTPMTFIKLKCKHGVEENETILSMANA